MTPDSGAHDGQARAVAPRSAGIGYLIALLALATVCQTVDRTVFSMALAPIKVEFDLTDGQLGLLNGFAFGLVYIVASLPLARLADTWSARNVIAGCVAAWSLFTALTAAATGFTQLFVARLFVGVSESGCAPAAQAMIASRVPPERRASAIATYLAGGYVGLIVALVLGGMIIERWGWQMAFIALAVPGMVLACALIFSLRNRQDRKDVRPPAFREALAAMRQPVVLHLCLAMTSTGFVSYGVLGWAPVYYIRTFGMKVSEAGFYLGLTVGVGTVIGAVLGGWISDRLRRRHPSTALAFAGWAFLINGALTVAVFAVSGLNASLVLMFAAMVVGGMPVGPVYGAIHNNVPPSLRASSIAILSVATAFIGHGLGPLATGILSDYLASSGGVANGLKWALVTLTILGAWPPIHVFIAARGERQRTSPASDPARLAETLPVGTTVPQLP